MSRDEKKDEKRQADQKHASARSSTVISVLGDKAEDVIGQLASIAKTCNESGIPGLPDMHAHITDNVHGKGGRYITFSDAKSSTQFYLPPQKKREAAPAQTQNGNGHGVLIATRRQPAHDLLLHACAGFNTAVVQGGGCFSHDGDRTVDYPTRGTFAQFLTHCVALAHPAPVAIAEGRPDGRVIPPGGIAIDRIAPHGGLAIDRVVAGRDERDEHKDEKRGEREEKAQDQPGAPRDRLEGELDEVEGAGPEGQRDEKERDRDSIKGRREKKDVNGEIDFKKIEGLMRDMDSIKRVVDKDGVRDMANPDDEKDNLHGVAFIDKGVYQERNSSEQRIPDKLDGMDEKDEHKRNSGLDDASRLSPISIGSPLFFANHANYSNFSTDADVKVHDRLNSPSAPPLSPSAPPPSPVSVNPDAPGADAKQQHPYSESRGDARPAPLDVDVYDREKEERERREMKSAAAPDSAHAVHVDVEAGAGEVSIRVGVASVVDGDAVLAEVPLARQGTLRIYGQQASPTTFALPSSHAERATPSSAAHADAAHDGEKSPKSPKSPVDDSENFQTPKSG